MALLGLFPLAAITATQTQATLHSHRARYRHATGICYRQATGRLQARHRHAKGMLQARHRHATGTLQARY